MSDTRPYGVASSGGEPLLLYSDQRHLDSGLTNARVESTNTKIRLLTRIAYGFQSADAVIAIAMLALGGHHATTRCRQRHAANDVCHLQESYPG